MLFFLVICSLIVHNTDLSPPLRDKNCSNVEISTPEKTTMAAGLSFLNSNIRPTQARKKRRRYADARIKTRFVDIKRNNQNIVIICFNKQSMIQGKTFIFVQTKVKGRVENTSFFLLGQLL